MVSSSNTFSKRLVVLGGVFVLFGILIGLKLFYVQVVHSKDYLESADRSYMTKTSTDERGNINVINKDGVSVSLATMHEGYVLAITPVNFEGSVSEFCETIIELLVVPDCVEIEEKIKQNDPHYIEIKDKLERYVVDQIKEKDFKGVTISRRDFRYYPGEDLLAQTLGFVAYSGNEKTGQYGIERQFDETLRRSGDGMEINVFAEIFGNIRRSVWSEGKEGDVVLTIEPEVEKKLETLMDEVLTKYDARSANAIVIDPRTGEILAMTESPRFDLNSFGAVEDPGIYRNSLVENLYEFGSVVKPLVIAAGINEGVISPDETYYDSGFVVVGPKEIKNFDGKGRGEVTFTRALGESLNTAMVLTSQRLGADKFLEYMKSYGLGEKTGVELPGEVKGRIGNLETKRPVEHATASFGQGISFNVLTLVRALSSVANGGYLPDIHLVKEVDYVEGGSDEYEIKEPEDLKRVFTEETSDTLTTMLVTNVDSILGEGRYSMPNHSIAAKTGTAQIPNPSGGYYEDRNLHSFFGYFPAYDPEFLVYMSVHEPRGVRYASETLSKPFFDLTSFLIAYYNIAGDR